MIKSTILALLLAGDTVRALAPPSTSRREWLNQASMGLGVTTLFPALANADVDIDSYMKTGGVSMPMGVSGQGGKMRPETGVIFREGSEVSRDPRSGDVLAEILLKSTKGGAEKLPVLTAFQSPWPLASGDTYDIECRDSQTGDGAYLAVSADVKGKSIEELSNQFFSEQLFSSTGRFSFYGAPTDVKFRKPVMNGNYKIVDIDFSILSQSTGAEVPRKARLVATIPEGSNQVVMLVASASAARWKKGADQKIAATIDSFRATPAPQTGVAVRAKQSS